MQRAAPKRMFISLSDVEKGENREDVHVEWHVFFMESSSLADCDVHEHSRTQASAKKHDLSEIRIKILRL